ncbi:MAG: hypothetical protein SFX18_07815 [Pirellulales bacterium]|nr:hypothetical protein [Pirellulales bacterium]
MKSNLAELAFSSRSYTLQIASLAESMLLVCAIFFLYTPVRSHELYHYTPMYGTSICIFILSRLIAYIANQETIIGTIIKIAGFIAIIIYAQHLQALGG